MPAVETQKISVSNDALDYESLDRIVNADSQTRSVHFQKKQLVVLLLSIASALIFCEAMARIIVYIGKPVQYGQTEFDSKMAIARQKLPAGKPCLYLVGASYTSRGFYSELLQKNLNDAGHSIAVRNLGCISAYPQDTLLLLNEALRNSPGPAAVVHEVLPTLAVIPPQKAALMTQIHARYLRDSYVGESESSDWPKFQNIHRFLKRNLCLLKYRSYLKSTMSGLTTSLWSPEAGILERTVKPVSGYSSPLGWTPGFEFIADDYWKNFEKEKQTKETKRDKWITPVDQIDRNNPQYTVLKPIFQYCKERKLPLILYWNPVHPLSKKEHEKLIPFTDAEWNQMFSTVSKREGALYLDLHDVDDPSYFYDNNHINVMGSIAITQRFSKELQSMPFRAVVEQLSGGAK